MILINLFLYKNNKLIKNNLNIKALYDKTMQRLSFSDSEFEFQIDILNEELNFKKENEEYLFYLNINKKISNSSIKLKKIGHDFKIEVLKSTYKVDKKQIYLQYCLETEPDTVNEFIIQLETDIL